VVGAGKIAWHLRAGEDRELFAQMLLEIYQLRKPDLNIVDAVTAMEGDGPSGGDPRHVGLLIAGGNAVSVDVIAGEILDIPKKLLYLERVAAKLDITGIERTSIHVSGHPLQEVRVKDFKLPPISDVQFGLPRFLARYIRQYFTAYPYPLPGKCKLCGICKDACPPGAIEIRDGSLEIDNPKCIRCFCCRELCPENALGVREGKLLRIIKKCI
jgi:ferredoxin